MFSAIVIISASDDPPPLSPLPVEIVSKRLSNNIFPSFKFLVISALGWNPYISGGALGGSWSI